MFTMWFRELVLALILVNSTTESGPGESGPGMDPNGTWS